MIKLQAKKKETLAQLFSYEFCEISMNIFFTEHLWATASKKGITGKTATSVNLFQYLFINGYKPSILRRLIVLEKTYHLQAICEITIRETLTIP